MKSMNPDVAQLQINLKQAVAELDKHMRHGQCDEKAFALSCGVALAANHLRSEIGAESVRKANPESKPEVQYHPV